MKTWSSWPTSAVVLCFAAAMVRCGASDSGAALSGGADADEEERDDNAADAGIPTVGGTGGAAPSLPPEEERESSFRVPVATDHYVWTANPLSGMVALIDARDRSVRTVPAGFGPTYLAAVPTPEGSDESRAIVINVLSQDAHLLIARADGGIDSYRINGIHSGANSWTVSPGGRWAIAWTNVAEVTDPDPIEGFQDISIVDLDAVGEDTVEATRLSVAFRPTRLFISDDETRAFAVTEPGITVIDLSGTSSRVVEDLPVSEGAIDDPAARDVTVTPDGQFALVRRDDSSDVGIVSMDSGDIVTVPLSAPVTDLDLSGDGRIAVAVMRSRYVEVDVGAGGTPGASGAAGASAAGGAAQAAGAAGDLGVSGSAGMLGTGGVVAAGGSAAQGGAAGTSEAGGSAGTAPTGGEGGAAPGGAAGAAGVAGAPGLAGAVGSSAGASGVAGVAGSSGGGAAGLAGLAGWPGGAFGSAGAAGWLTVAGAAGVAGSAGNAGEAGLLDPGTGGLPATGGAVGSGGLASGGDTGAGGTSSGGSGVGGGTGGLPTGGTGGLLTGGSGGLLVGAGGGSGGTPTITYELTQSEVAVLSIPEIFTAPDACTPGESEDTDVCAVVTISDEESGDEIVGSVSLSEQGTQALLFTTADAPAEAPQANQHLTVLDLSGGDGYLTLRTEHLRAAVHAVFVSPDDGHAIALLTPGPTSTMAGAFSVVPVSEPLPPRIQGTTAPPVGVALAASPANMGLVTVSDPASEIYEAYLVQLPGLQVDAFELVHRPLATGIVPSVAAGYVAQEHPDGRITFITLDSDDQPIDYTLTGFELGATTGR